MIAGRSPKRVIQTGARSNQALFQTLTLPLGRCADDVRSKVELVREEVVGMLSLDAIRLVDSLGKVLEVEGHNDREMAHSQ